MQGGGDLGTTSNPVLLTGTQAVRKSMSSAVALMDGQLRSLASTHDISVGPQRMITKTDATEGGCEWTIHFLRDLSLDERGGDLATIIKKIRPSISPAWDVKPSRRNTGIRITPTPTGFRDIDEADKSHAPRVVALLGTLFVILILALLLGLF